MRTTRLFPLVLLSVAMYVSGCGEQQPLGGPAYVVDERGAAAGADSAPDNNTAVEPELNDEIWRGLEPHEIQLDQKLLVVRGSRGVIGCGYLNIAAFEKYGEACAVVPAVDLASMPDAKVTAVTTKAKELGITVGMSGREALDRIR